MKQNFYKSNAKLKNNSLKSFLYIYKEEKG